ncbi:MAG: 5-formyltetrahydrofolate cyclo-ligase [Coriobacteriaceae bacterium]|nr:5-formyltetrahydrofolate cyclo-ligase [Coriobacteriaceae bacterium]
MSGTVETPKGALRRRMLALRLAIPAAARADADARIARRVRELPAFAAAGTVFTYLSFGPEVDTRALIAAAQAAGKTVALPRVAGRRALTWHAVSDLADLVPSSFGMDEPDGSTPPIDPGLDSSAVALVPGLAFDGRGFRLGYGGGFYDAFLSGFAGVSIGLCRVAQRVDDLAALGAREGHDRAVDVVVGEDGPRFTADGAPAGPLGSSGVL